MSENLLDYVKRLEEAYLEAKTEWVDEYSTSSGSDVVALNELNKLRAEFGLPPRT